MSFQRLLLPFLALLLVAAPLHPARALALPEGVKEITTVEGITEYRLPNGLRVLLFPDPTKPTVTVNITYEVGSRHENYGETGMAHLLEHLLFKDTRKHKDIPGEMKKRGISFNATTWLDRTNYFGIFAADEATLDWLLELEADRMVNALVRREDLDSEMTVVRNEMEAGENNPVGVLIERVMSTAYLWHNYGNSTIGARADVENLPIERLQDFYRRYYRPDNATLLVAGRIDPERTLARIVATFGAIPRPSAPIPVTYTREPTQDGEREVHVRRVGETRYIATGYHIPAGRHPDFAPLALLADILGNTPTGRLHKALVENKLATWVAAFGMQLVEPGYLMFIAEAPKDGDPAALEARLIELVEAIAKQPITQAELDDAKRRAAKNVEKILNDPNRLALGLSESIAQGDWRLFFLARDRAETTTLEDVNRVAAQYLKPSNRTLGWFIPTPAPDRAEIGEAPPAAELLKGYTGRAAVAPGEVFEATPENIDRRTQLAELSNGTKLALLSKDTRGDTVNFMLEFRFGSAEELQDRALAARMVGEMLTRGTRRHSREEIARRFDELKAQVNVSGGPQTVRVGGDTVREHLPALLDLIAEILREPAFPEAEFEQLRTQMITEVESQMTEPDARAFNALSRHFQRWPKGHPRYVASFEEQLESLRAIRLEDLRRFHAEFYGSGDGEIVVVGDFDPAEIGARLEALFGDFTRPRPWVRIPDPYVEVEAVTRRIETPDKANAVWVTRADLPVSDTDPDYPALVIANYVLGGGALKSRLADRIRQRDGLSYGVGSNFSARPLDRHAQLMAYAIAAPENIDRVNAAFDEELAKFIAEGIHEDELRDAVNGLLRARQTGRGEDRALTSKLGDLRYLGRTMAFEAAFDEQLRKLTVEQVNAAIRKHIGKLGFTRIMAGDFAKLNGKPAN
ncbi:MAG: peptidase M16 [Lysobacteraceae bacterium]|nr:MAG: peptidase M16 [Xanthomonadaceae bacterium]